MFDVRAEGRMENISRSTIKSVSARRESNAGCMLAWSRDD